jgi:membrane protein
MDFKRVVRILEEIIHLWDRDNVPLYAAAIAYYALFSLVPLLILFLLFINMTFRSEPMGEQIVAQVQRTTGLQDAQFLGEMIEQAAERASSFKFTFFSFLLLLFGATGLFVHTKRALQSIWQLEPRIEPTLLAAARSYLLSILLIALVGFSLTLLSSITAIVLPLAGMIEQHLPLQLGLLKILTYLISFSTIALLFAVTYLALSEGKLAWRDVIPGSLAAALLFAIGNLLVETYVSAVDIASAYGAAASLVIFLLWVYCSAQIFLFGAELIKVTKFPKEELRAYC